MDKIDYKKVSASLVAFALALVVYIADDMREKVDIIPELQQDIALMNQQIEHDRQTIKRIVMAIQSDLDQLKDGRQYIIAEQPAWRFLSPGNVQAVAPPLLDSEET